MRRCVFTLLAQADFQDIHDYIAEKDFDSALDLVTQLQLACDNLATMPELGRKRDELAPDLRSLPVGRHIVFYRIVGEGVEILRVLHGAQDIEGIFTGKRKSRTNRQQARTKKRE